MSDPVYQFINETGTILADTAGLRNAVSEEYVAALGAGLNTAPSTPQGILITAETLARDAVMRNNADLANQINPNISGGIFLESVCALMGLIPTTKRKSIVAGVLLSGNAGVTIQAGVRIKGASESLFASVATVTLDGSGEAAVDFESVEYGAIEAPAGSLTTIVDGVLGWGAVINPTAAVVGAQEQSDSSLRRKRILTLGIQGVGSVPAILANVTAVDGVTSVSVRENDTDATATIDGIVMPRNSIWVCVDGGVDTAVAEALLKSKSGGQPWTHGTGTGIPVTIQLPSPKSGQMYGVKFTRETEIPCLAKVTVARSSLTTLELTAACEDAIVRYANGELDEEGLVLGVDVSPFELSGAINRLHPSIFVKKVEVTTVADNNFQVAEIPIALWQKATIVAGSVSVVVV